MGPSTLAKDVGRVCALAYIAGRRPENAQQRLVRHGLFQHDPLEDVLERETGPRRIVAFARCERAPRLLELVAQVRVDRGMRRAEGEQATGGPRVALGGDDLGEAMQRREGEDWTAERKCLFRDGREGR